MSIKDFLVEAKPLDYVAGPATSRVPNVNALWTFTNGSQTFMLRANFLRKGKMADYKRIAGAVMYVLSTIDPDTGKVNRRIQSMKNALSVVTTVGAIISSELLENKKTTCAMFRTPSVMGDPERVVRLAHRMVKMKAPQFEVAGAIEVGSFYYVMIVKRGTDPMIQDIFGVPGKLTVYNLIQEPNEDTSAEIEKKLEPQIKAKTPVKISIKGVVGNRDIPDVASDFIIKNPTISDLVRKGNKFGTQKLEGFHDDLSTRLSPNLARYDVMNALAWHKMLGNQDMEDEIQALIDDGKLTIDYVINNGVEFIDKLKAAYPNVELIEIRKFMNRLTDEMLIGLSNVMEQRYKEFKLQGSEQSNAMIKHYTGGGYEDVNSFLLSGEDEFGDAEKMTEKMDAAFVDCARMINIDNVYRSMSFKGAYKKDVVDALPGKLFHFRPWVSTSLSPHLGWGFNAGRMNVFNNPTKYTELKLESLDFRVKCAMNIHGVKKIPVVVPGGDSKHVPECEVILPRGTTLRINSCYGLLEPLITGGYTCGHVFWDMDIIAPDEILEEVYDGDALLETGELVLMQEGFVLQETRVPEVPVHGLTMFKAVVNAAMGQEDNSKLNPSKYKELEQNRVKFNTQIM